MEGQSTTGLIVSVQRPSLSKGWFVTRSNFSSNASFLLKSKGQSLIMRIQIPSVTKFGPRHTQVWSAPHFSKVDSGPGPAGLLNSRGWPTIDHQIKGAMMSQTGFYGGSRVSGRSLGQQSQAATPFCLTFTQLAWELRFEAFLWLPTKKILGTLDGIVWRWGWLGELFDRVGSNRLVPLDFHAMHPAERVQSIMRSIPRQKTLLIVFSLQQTHQCPPFEYA